MLSLVQIRHPSEGRRVTVVEADRLRGLEGYKSVYACAHAALENGEALAALVERSLSIQTFDYDAIYADQSAWKLLPAFDHPTEPARCLVSGTGLTHRKSADNRNAMHQADSLPSDSAASVAPTDSMRMYQWGVEGGRPSVGAIGAQPEWFYKGNGSLLRAHGEPLDLPAYAEDGGEEAEIAGLYLIDANGAPWRVGFALANEFSDHQMEARNYLYLAPSKLRTCALGPELLVGADFADARGRVTLERAGQPLWTQEVASGEANMVHTLANLEHHHFKYAAHRNPGDAHVHFFGTGGFSFGSDIRLQDGDTMTVAFEGYGRSLVNPLRVETGSATLMTVRAL